MANQYINDLMNDIDCQSSILAGEREGFMLSLMVASSYIIKADDRIMHSEMEFMRSFLTTYYGEEKKVRYEKLLLALFAESKKHSQEMWEAKIERCVRTMVSYTTEEQRLLLLSFLIRITRVDGSVAGAEVAAIDKVANWLEITVPATETIETLKLQAFDLWTL